MFASLFTVKSEHFSRQGSIVEQWSESAEILRVSCLGRENGDGTTCAAR
jgi:hypothetical protein